MKYSIIITLLLTTVIHGINGQTFTVYKNDVDNSLQALAIDEANDRVWVGTNATTTGNTFAFLENNEWTIINATEKGLISGRATDIAIMDNQVAMSSYGGVSLVDWENQVFETFTSANSPLRVDAVQALAYDDQEDRLYIGNSNGFGVFTIDANGWGEEIKEADFLDHLVYDENNDVLYGGGVRSEIIQVKNGTVSSIDLGVFTYCTGLALDNDDNLWVATEFGKGIFKYDGNTITNYNSTNSLIPEGDINGIAVTTDGYIWFVASNKLYRFDETDITVYDPFETDLPTGNIRQMKADSKGNLWLASAAGLVKVSPSVTSTQQSTSSIIKLYPNPMISYLKIEGSNGPYRTKIYNTTGAMIHDVNNARHIPTDHLQEGIYLVEVTDRSGQISLHRVLKQ